MRSLGVDPIEFRLMHITRPQTGRRLAIPTTHSRLVEVLERRCESLRGGTRETRSRAAPGTLQTRLRASAMTQHHGGLDGLSRGRGSVRRARGGQGRVGLRHAELESRLARPWCIDEDCVARQRVECWDCARGIWSLKCSVSRAATGFASSGATPTSRRRATSGSADELSRCRARRPAAQPTNSERICSSARPAY